MRTVWKAVFLLLKIVAVLVLLFVLWTVGWSTGLQAKLEVEINNLSAKEEVRGEVLCQSTRFEHVFKKEKFLEKGLFGYSVRDDPAFYNKLRITNSEGNSVNLGIGHFNNEFRVSKENLLNAREGAQMFDVSGVLRLSPEQKDGVVEIGTPEPGDHPYPTTPGTLEDRVDYYSVFIGFEAGFITKNEFSAVAGCEGLEALVQDAFRYENRYRNPPHIFFFQND